MIDDSTQYIARISYGKDSLKMLDVIHSRGLPLDRITTTEVWATDTISANLPPIQKFKERMDQWIWDRYRIEVEHLCAVNPDGTRRTYEQMFYHVPKRRSQDVQVEREREPVRRRQQIRLPDQVVQVVSGSQAEASRDSQVCCTQNGVRVSRPNGFPATISPWCRKLKIDKVRTPFLRGGPRLAPAKQKSWNTSASPPMSRSGLGS